MKLKKLHEILDKAATNQIPNIPPLLPLPYILGSEQVQFMSFRKSHNLEADIRKDGNSSSGPRSVQMKTSSRIWNVHHHLETDCELPYVKNIGTFDQKREGVSFLWKSCNKAKLKFFLLQKTKEPFKCPWHQQATLFRQGFKMKQSSVCLYTSKLPKVQLSTQSRHDMLYTCLYIQGGSKYWPNITSNTHCPVWDDISAVS